jgi:hypothetical protein
MSNANSNPVSQEAVSFINNINFADPDSLKNSMLTLVNSMIDLQNKNAELVAALKEKQALPQPQQGPVQPPGQTKPYKGEKFSGETNLEVDEFLRQVKLQCDMDRTSVNMKKLVLLSGITGRVYQEVRSTENPQHPFTYTEFKDFLKSRFLDTSKSDKAYREIHTIRQTGGIQGFNKIFSKNVLLIDPRPAEKLLLNAYTTAVKKDLALHIWTQKPAILAEAMTLVEGLEDLIQAHEIPAERISYRGDPNPTPTTIQTKFEEKTTTSSPAIPTRQLSYPTTPSTRATGAQPPASLNDDQKVLWKRGLCFRCKQKYEPGHAKVCPQWKPHVNNTENVTDEINEELDYTTIIPYPKIEQPKNGSSEMEGALPTPRECKSMLPPTSKFKGSTPIVSDTTPVVSDTTPVVSDTTPVVSDTTPVVSDTTPVVSDTTPIVSDTTPIVSDTTPVVSDTTPVVSDTTPVVSDTTPVVSDTILVTSETIPSVGAASGASMLRHEYGYELSKIERSLLLPVTITGHEVEVLVDNSAEIDIISA